MQMLLLIFMILTAGKVAAAGIDGYVAAEIDGKQLRPGVQARDSWRQVAPSDYQYRLRAQCQCPLNGISTVYVIEGRVARVEDDAGRQRSLPDELQQTLTIPALHALIDRYAASQPDRMAWQLNRYLGYPERIEIDPAYRIADDEVRYSLDDFRILQKQ